MALTITNTNQHYLLNSTGRLSVIVQDDSSADTDPYRLTFTLSDLGDSAVIEDAWPSPAYRIVKDAVGHFHVDIGPAMAELDGSHAIGSTTITVKTCKPSDSEAWPDEGTLTIDLGKNKETVDYSAVSITAGMGTFTLTSGTTIEHSDAIPIVGPNSETDALGDFVFNWQVELTEGGLLSNSVGKIKVISTRALSFVPEFRQLIDKSIKFTSSDNSCFLGYSDSQLISYLEGGLQNINAYQPSMTFTFENYPLEYRQVLLDAALITGVMSQQLYAIDTDIPSYNDQGTSFVITHQPQLAAFLNQVTTRLDKIIPMMKLQLLSSGSLHTVAGPDFRLNTVVSAAPPGSIFRNVYFSS